MRPRIAIVWFVLLAGCASAPAGLSFEERLEAQAAAKVTEVCGEKTNKTQERCASRVRYEFFSRPPFPTAKNRGNENAWPTSREVASD